MIALTPREREVYGLVVTEGMQGVVIAKTLGISDQTVRRHMNSIYNKTGASCALELVVWHYTKDNHAKEK